MYPLKLTPIYDKTIWANNRLTSMRGMEESGFGTVWEVSAHPYANSIIENGVYKGKALNELIDEFPKEMLGKKELRQMLRLAYLDAADNLSIQVHPYDEYAHTHEHDEGKTESWYILEAEEGASLVAGTTTADAQVMRQAVEDGTVEQYVKHVPVKAGDFVCIDAGMLHALGKGILALEIGQNSNTTYRFYDYGRKDAAGNERELHVKKSFDVADFSLECKAIHNPWLQEPQEKMLVDRDEFCVKLVDVIDEYELVLDGERFFCVSNMKEDATIFDGEEEIPFAYSESIFIPAVCKNIKIKGTTRLLVSYVKQISHNYGSQNIGNHEKQGVFRCFLILETL